MQFRQGDQVMLPSGEVGTVISGASDNLSEAAADAMVVVEISKNGVPVRQLVAEDELLESIREAR